MKCINCKEHDAVEVVEDREVDTPDGRVTIKDDRFFRCEGNVGSEDCDDFYFGFQSVVRDDKVMTARLEARLRAFTRATIAEQVIDMISIRAVFLRDPYALEPLPADKCNPRRRYEFTDSSYIEWNDKPRNAGGGWEARSKNDGGPTPQERALETAKAKMDIRLSNGLDRHDDQELRETIGTLSWDTVKALEITDYYDVVCEEVHAYVSQMS